jgi:hypothetical protein
MTSLTALFAIAVIVSMMRYGAIARDADLLHDVARIQAFLPRGSTLCASESLQRDALLRAQLYRQHFISVGPPTEPSPLCLSALRDAPEAFESHLSGSLDLRRYRLFVRAPAREAASDDAAQTARALKTSGQQDRERR